ncbi:hypothetical protein QCA50_001615 [Cerrena zonata]|uniref:Rhodanese domain-containing protein n=1 Tax=Cerrena zonata TaxID=2478898 RepID=A0AAW0GTR1_9APHY
MLLRFLPKRTPSLGRFISARYMTSGSIFGDSCPLVVTPKQLYDLPSGSVTVLDASWHMPNSPRKAKEEFLSKRLPNAQFLDLDEVASPHELGLKHMIPSEETFAGACETLGITPQSHVVIYDSHGVFSSPRALFMFRAFGHERSSILNGGLPNWEAHGCQVETGEVKPSKKAKYPAPRLDNSIIRSYEQMISNAQHDPSEQSIAELVLDARSKGRYLGVDPEPRPGLSSGHMPHSLSLPFNAFLDTNTFKPSPDAAEVSYTTVRTSQEIIETLRDAVGDEKLKEIVEGKRGVVTSCGSGMTAGVLWLGLKLLGVDKVALYDESWTGYAMRESSPIVKSE